MQESRRITQRSASNLALAFCLLPRTTRDDMAVLYAFCREVDDVADAPGLTEEERRARLEVWREDLDRAYAGQQPRLPVCQELQPGIFWYRLPRMLFDELLRGVAMDLEIRRYPTWDHLELYCHRVASVVGLLSLPIFGCRHPASRDYAVALGRALQLTNILRDVAHDAARDRIYLPLEELQATGVAEGDILSGRYTPAYAELARRVARRARRWYRQARDRLPEVDRRALIAAELMGAVYWRVLKRLERRGFNVFEGPPVRVPTWQKAALVGLTWLRYARQQPVSDYGWD